MTLTDTFETYTVHTCLESLENDPELPSKLCKLKDGDELLEIGLGLGVVVGSGTVGTMVHVSGGDSPAGGGRGTVEMHTVQTGVLTAADGAATGGASLTGGSVRGGGAAGGGMKNWQT